MTLTIGDTAPDFTAETTLGWIEFHEWIGESWCVLFSHPKDFTPVCTTEIGAMARLMPEFDRRGVKVIGLSIDTRRDHERWMTDVEETQGARPAFPIIADDDLAVAKLYGMLPAEAAPAAGGRTAIDNQTVRSLFVIAPDRTIRLTITYPMSTGRDFGEVLRVIDSLQLTARHKVATPANWRSGDAVIILPTVSDEAAREAFPVGWIAPKPYLRLVSQPR